MADGRFVSGREQVDLSNCAREPIHVPGAIQPHGVLLVLRKRDLTITRVSANTLEVFGISPQELLEMPLASLIEEDQEPYIRESLQLEDVALADPIDVRLRHDEGRSFDGILHHYNGALILELEPRSARDTEQKPYATRGLVASLERLQRALNIQALCEAAAEEVRGITGFDRVMVYRFDPGWNGEVVAEAKAEDVDGYLHHRFPASDIPRQARDLYTLNWIRIIPTANYEPAGLLLAAGETRKPLDMSFCVLRSVSPIHLEYLKNMGVDASMSISILVDGRLWGLIACHHRSPRYLPYPVRQDCQFLGQVASSQIAVRVATSSYTYQTERIEMAAKFTARAAGAPYFGGALTDFRPSLLDHTSATGAAVLFDDRCTVVGEAPDEDVLKDIRRWLASEVDEPIFWTDSLASVYKPAAGLKDVASGLLAVEVLRERGCYALWFRPEVVRTLTWGGDPNKPVTVGAHGRINPRESFESWKEIVRLRSLPWTEPEINAVRELRNVLVSLVRAEIERDRAAEQERAREAAEALERQRISRELHDRVAHTMGIVHQSLQLYETLQESNPEMARAKMSLAQQMTKEALDLTRDLSSKLRTMEVENELHSALSSLLEAVVPPGLEYTFSVEGDEALVPPHVHEQLFMILREGVRNAISHSEASRVEVGVRISSKQVVGYVIDDGRGFAEEDVAAGGGLRSMRERASLVGGALELTSKPGVGTTIEASIPLEEKSVSGT